MGASFSSNITSYPYLQRAKSLLSSIFFNNTTALPVTDITIASKTPNVQNHTQDDSEGIAEQVQTISIAVGTGSCTLLINPPEYVHNRHVLYNIYLLLLFLSFGSTAALVYIPKSTPSLGGAWLQKQALQVAIVSLVLSVFLKIFLLLSTPIEWYDVLIPLLLLGGLSLYLRYGWIKANNSRQTSPDIPTPIGDIWKGTAKKVQPISIGVGAGSCTLLANPPKYVHNRRVQYKLFLLFLLLSFGSTASLVYIPKTTPSPGGSWFQKQALTIAIVSFVISVTLRIFLLLTSIEWYEVLILLLLLSGSSLYLRSGWIKANNSRQTSTSSTNVEETRSKHTQMVPVSAPQMLPPVTMSPNNLSKTQESIKNNQTGTSSTTGHVKDEARETVEN